MKMPCLRRWTVLCGPDRATPILQEDRPNLLTFGRNRQGTLAMADDRPEDMEPPSDSGRAKRAPPTIDLEATEVSGETQSAGTGDQPKRPFAWPSRAAISSAVIAAGSGAAAAALG